MLDELFSAGLDRSIVCSSFNTSYCCQTCGTTKEAFAGNVTDPILNLDIEQSISSALLKRLSGDVVTVHCANCHSDQKCVELSSFSNLPNILIIRLRRDQFDGSQGSRRIGKRVVCERKLTIGQNTNIPPFTYHLIAVSHHQGPSLSNGHYTH